MSHSTSNDGTQRKLRLLTYLCPGLPIGLFQTYQYYLEEVLGCESYLMIENRYSAPSKEKVDPFTANDVDIAFMCSTGYVRLLDERNTFMELLPAAPVYNDPKNANARPVYFSDVIIRSEKASKYKEFADLRGHRWAANDVESLSGNIIMFAELKALGVNASFFGHIVHSGSHHESINMVLNNVVDSAAIDSNTLRFWSDDHPQQATELHVLCSWGPNPVQPIVINSRLPGEIKDKIVDALLKVNEHPEFSKRFEKYGITGFLPVDSAFYDRTREIMDLAKAEELYPAYY